jgi:hypothetical protein
MATAPTPDPALLSINQRLSHLELQVSDIHRAMVGSMDGQQRGLQARVERLESWARWLGGLVTMAIGAAITALVRGQH